jgi:hypothetical protein
VLAGGANAAAAPHPSAASKFHSELNELQTFKSTLQGELESLGVRLAASSVDMECASTQLQDRQRAATGALYHVFFHFICQPASHL